MRKINISHLKRLQSVTPENVQANNCSPRPNGQQEVTAQRS